MNVGGDHGRLFKRKISIRPCIVIKLHGGQSVGRHSDLEHSIYKAILALPLGNTERWTVGQTLLGLHVVMFTHR